MQGRIPPLSSAPTASLTSTKLEKKESKLKYSNTVRKAPTDGVALTIVRNGKKTKEKLLFIRADVVEGDKGDDWICAAQQAVRSIDNIGKKVISNHILLAQNGLSLQGIEMVVEQQFQYRQRGQMNQYPYVLSFNPTNLLKYFTWFAINEMHATKEYQLKIENVLAFCKHVFKKKKGAHKSTLPVDVINHYLPEFRDEIVKTKTVTRIALPHCITPPKKIKTIRHATSPEDTHAIKLFGVANLRLQKQIIDEEKQQAVWICTLDTSFLSKLFGNVINEISRLTKDKILPQRGYIIFVNDKNASHNAVVTHNRLYTDQDCFIVFDTLINLKNSGKKRTVLKLDKISETAIRLRDTLLERDPSAPPDDPKDSITIRAQKWRWAKKVTNKQLISITSDQITLVPVAPETSQMDLSTDHDGSKRDQEATHSHSAASSAQHATTVQSQDPSTSSARTETKAGPTQDASAMGTLDYAYASSSHTFLPAMNVAQVETFAAPEFPHSAEFAEAKSFTASDHVIQQLLSAQQPRKISPFDLFETGQLNEEKGELSFDSLPLDAYMNSFSDTERDKLRRSRSSLFPMKHGRDASSAQSPTSAKRPRLEEQLRAATGATTSEAESSEADFVNSLLSPTL